MLLAKSEFFPLFFFLSLFARRRLPRPIRIGWVPTISLPFDKRRCVSKEWITGYRVWIVSRKKCTYVHWYNERNVVDVDVSLRSLTRIISKSLVPRPINGIYRRMFDSYIPWYVYTFAFVYTLDKYFDRIYKYFIDTWRRPKAEDKQSSLVRYVKFRLCRVQIISK